MQQYYESLPDLIVDRYAASQKILRRVKRELAVYFLMLNNSEPMTKEYLMQKVNRVQGSNFPPETILSDKLRSFYTIIDSCINVLTKSLIHDNHISTTEVDGP